MVKAVVIGGGGYMGQSLTKALVNKGYEVTVLDLVLRKFDQMDLDSSSFRFVQGSFLDIRILQPLLEDVEVVFHLAAVGMTGKNRKNRKLIEEVNVDGVSILLNECKKFHIKRFIFASSCICIFTGDTLRDATEDYPRPKLENVTSWYGQSKARAEELISNHASTEFRTASLRFRGVYGPGELNITDRVASYIQSGLLIARCQKYDRIVTQYTSIDNCVHGFLISDETLKNENGPNGQNYHILDDEKVGNYEFWEPLFKVFGRELPLIRVPYLFVFYFLMFYEAFLYKFVDFGEFTSTTELNLMALTNTFSTDKAKLELGYKPKPSMMPEVVAYYKSKKLKRPLQISFQKLSTVRVLICFLIILSSYFLI